MTEYHETNRTNACGIIYEMPDLQDYPYSDSQVAERTTKNLRRIKERKRPYFIEYGFIRIHLHPMRRKIHGALYDSDTIPQADDSKEASRTLYSGGDFGNEASHRMLRHGCFASVS